MKIWDLPLRLFHWLFGVCVIGSIITGKMENWDLHERFGLAIMGLVLFRIIWGFSGSETARFRHFIKGPKAVYRNVKAIFYRQAGEDKGHSALGGWATLALLAVPAGLAFTGVFSTDGILYDGPLAHLVSFQESQDLAHLHHDIEPFLFLILLLHFLAMGVYYFWLKKNLIPAMIKPATKAAQPALSRQKTYFGLVLLGVFMLLPQSLTLLRPALY